MNADVLLRMVELVKMGRIDDSVVAEILEMSGVELICGGVCGTYAKGMLAVGDGLKTLDPLGLTGFRMPTPTPAPAPALVPDPDPDPDPAPAPAPELLD